ncbi:HAD family hydrolase [Arenibacter sp. GZD96]|uniref:HAD family hydrolase n=1 Tax=Aurantibrevibacter litoralis TaxID=3106030 RepID=UPI002B0018AE|nr:HAD family hydrolase [Arenibacter sp. GZD-96]MEA1785422.1 HAD family hydrolase [Arenibacter sp. GZD-96]
MDFSKIKMVVSDMDGTLLNSKHEVSSQFFRLFYELQKRNILFVAASGRQYNSIVDKLHPIKDDIIIIAENGGFAKHRNEELLATPLPTKHTTTVLDILEQIEGAYPVLCSKYNAFVTNKSPEFVAKLREYYSAFEIVNALSDFDGEIMKIATYHFDSSEKFLYPAVQQFETELKVKISGENWMDISDINAHKGFALQKIQKLHGILPEETMVFGDYNNDLEMLAQGHFSFAMENAHPNVLQVANYRTSSNDAFGVERVLENLIARTTN